MEYVIDDMNKSLFHDLLFYSIYKRKYDMLASKAAQLNNEQWLEFINLLNYHGIASYFYRNMKINDLNSILPADILETLHYTYRLSMIRNLKIYTSLAKVLNELNNNNIQTIILKGAALAEIVYKDIALKNMSDVDILIKNEDIQKTDNILLNLGFKSDINNFVSKHHLRVANNIHYVGNEICIDLHPVIYNLFKIDPWINASEVKIYNVKTLILGAEEFLIHLCIHLNAHFYGSKSTRLIWWCDIATLIKHFKQNLNWKRFVYLSNMYDINKAVSKILLSISEWFEVEIPVNVFEQLNYRGEGISFDEVLNLKKEQLPLNETPKDDPQFRFLLLSISQMPTWYDKIILIFRIIFPSKNFITNRYSLGLKKFYHFYYLIYIGELIKAIVKGFPRYIKNKHNSIRDLIKDI